MNQNESKATPQPSSCHPAAIDKQIDSGDVTHIRAHQKLNHRSHLCGLPPTSHWSSGDDAISHVTACLLDGFLFADHGNEPRTDCVDADVVSRIPDCCISGDCCDCTLACVIGGGLAEPAYGAPNLLETLAMAP